MNVMSYAETARDIFMEGYGCAQAVFTAFAPLTGVEKNRHCVLRWASAAAWDGCAKSAAR